MTQTTPASGKDELREALQEMALSLRSGSRKGRHATGIFDIPILMKFIAQQNHQAVQTALEGLLEQKVDASWNEVQSTNEGFEVERLIREDAVPATAIEAVIAAVQARKNEREL